MTTANSSTNDIIMIAARYIGRISIDSHFATAKHRTIGVELARECIAQLLSQNDQDHHQHRHHNVCVSLTRSHLTIAQSDCVLFRAPIDTIALAAIGDVPFSRSVAIIVNHNSSTTIVPQNKLSNNNFYFNLNFDFDFDLPSDFGRDIDRQRSLCLILDFGLFAAQFTQCLEKLFVVGDAHAGGDDDCDLVAKSEIKSAYINPMYGQIPITRAESASSSNDDHLLPLLSNNDFTNIIQSSLSPSASSASSSSSAPPSSSHPFNEHIFPWYRSSGFSQLPHLAPPLFRRHLSNRNEMNYSNVVQMQAYFHGEIDHQIAGQLLRNDGDFLLRSSASRPYQIVLCALSDGGKFRQVLLGEDQTEIRCAGRRFPSIAHFVSYHFYTGQMIRCQTGEYFRILRPIVRAPRSG